MATRSYSRPADQSILPEQLQHVLEVALARTGVRVEVGSALIFVTHATLVSGDDAAVQSALAAYVYDPLWDASPERINLRGKIAVLRTWAQEGRDEVLAWDGQTQTQKNAATKVVIDRVSKFFDNFADFLKVQGID